MIDPTRRVPADRLRELLGREPFVRRLVVLDRVDSTNDEARRLAARGAPAGTVVIAGQQTAGRGRQGRPWFSAPGLGLYVTVLLRPAGPVEWLPRWTLAAAVAACAACRELSGAAVTIKWPNDLMCDGRKLGGVLAETRHAAGGPAELVLGTGLNVLHEPRDFPAELASTATSVRILAGAVPVDRERLAATYLGNLAQMAQALERGAWASVAERWERWAPRARGHRVRIKTGGAESAQIDGVTAGIDPLGALVVRQNDGAVVAVHAVDSVISLEG